MKILQIQLIQLRGWSPESEFPPGDRQSRPLDVYPEFNVDEEQITSRPKIQKEFYVEVFSDHGASGIFGPIDETQVLIIDKHLGHYLLGRDPLATELLWDQMMRLNRHGRTGYYMTGISALDCALWDLKGKYFDLPVYRLLGGPTRPDVPAYASMLGYSVEPVKAAEIALDFKSQGYTAQKWFFRFGPGDGNQGMSKNLAMAWAIRDAVGDRYHLMFDAYMGWDLPYAIEMARELALLNPLWLEEALPPERIEGFSKIRANGVSVATGEHVYTRWQVKQLLSEKAVDVLQTDPDWTGGISEQSKICALASAFDVPVYAHGHSLLPALHIAAAQSPAVVPMVEYLIRHQANKQFFHKPFYAPKNGSIPLPDLPGLGIAFDEEKITEKVIISTLTE
jgi:L-alanine-DL-glutamate epimerase-like enolase superfamily enzyme